jgi:hypothetical protein
LIDALKRKLGITPALPQAETVKEVETMEDKDNGGAALASADTNAGVDVAGLQASLASLTAELAGANDKIAELTAFAEAATEFQAAQAKAALDAKTAVRKLAVVEAVGTVKADALMAATASLEDGAFNAVMAAMKTTTDTEAETALFKEVGVDATADTSKLAADSNPVMDYLTAKYKSKA